MRALLISTYELGRQPFGLASPAAWLRAAGADVVCVDVAVDKRLDEHLLLQADLIAFYLPMHTATRIAVPLMDRARRLNPAAHLCAYGLYAPVNENLLRRHGVETILGGEFEAGLRRLVERLASGERVKGQRGPVISLERLNFLAPDRQGLPPLTKYARLHLPDGGHRIAGYTEASRGCKHLCRHCPIVPVYDGKFRIVSADIVMEDIRRQVAAGAQHITFGDPDFLNAPKHALDLVQRMRRETPALSFDVTVKVEHLLKHENMLPEFRDAGCAFVTTAVESIDDRVLTLLRKGHTHADFVRLVRIMRAIGLPLRPTIVAFTPWTTLEGYRGLLREIANLELVPNVAPVQLAIRLLIPPGSLLLELAEVRDLVGPFDEEALVFPWRHPDPRVDALQLTVRGIVEADGEDPFGGAWRAVHRAMDVPLPEGASAPAPARVTVPYLTEPWYC